MTPYRRTGEKTWVVTVHTGDRAKPYARLSTGTHDKPTAQAMQAMLDLLGEHGKRWLWIRDALCAMPRRLTVPVVYDHYVAGTLDALRERLADVDLRPLEAAWRTNLDRALVDETIAAETVRKYKAQVRVLVGAEGPIWRSTLTTAHLKGRLEALPGSGTNRRRHAAAWISFLDYATEHGALEANPLRALKLPKSNRTRERYAEWTAAMRLVQAMPAGLHRALAAFRHGAGVEMQAALRTTRRDVDLATRVVWAHGRKTVHRDRQVIVLDDACWAILEAYVRGGGFLPDARLFPVTAKGHAEAQATAAAKVGAEGVELPADYTLHAARHTFGVEMVRRGHEYKTISQNFGHASERLVMQLYAKHRSRAQDLVRSAQRVAGGAS